MAGARVRAKHVEINEFKELFLEASLSGASRACFWQQEQQRRRLE